MNTEIIQKKKQIEEQRQLLQNVKVQLKKEFIGLDDIIDRILDNISSWLHFPEIQERPIIINLWGLTGTGKTSLVKRIVQLIGYDHLYYNFDMAESQDKYFDIQDKLDDIFDNCNGKSFIIGLDEFQHARTINENGEEIEKASIKDVWKLLDSGRLEIIRFDYYIKNLFKTIKKLDMALAGGVEVVNGIVTEGSDVFRRIFDNDINLEDDSEDDEKSKELLFVSKKVLQDYVMNIIPADSEFVLLQDLQDKMKTLDGEQTIDFLLELGKEITKPKLVDCSKSLIFVMGNLDEVYNMNKDFNPDISADEFYEESLKITMPQVKNALLARFRSEQIARLGNTHLIYPALSEKAFYGILNLELEKIRKKVITLYGLNLVFEDSLAEFIYSEGVIPTQGTRPLFTTVQQIVRSQLGTIISEFYNQATEATNVHIGIVELGNDVSEVLMQLEFYQEKEKIHAIDIRIPMDLGKLRQEKQDDVQALVAVHESGHIVLSCILSNTLPQSAFSVTADSTSSGFTFSKKSWKYMSKKQIVNELAVYLGGYMAEKLIFGADNVTMGASSDLESATELAIRSLYNCGMGDYLAFFANPAISSVQTIIYDDVPLNEKISPNTQALYLLKEAEILAEETLKKQLNFLLALSDHLSDYRSINQEQIKSLLDKYGVDYDLSNLINKENSDKLFYRNHLKAKTDFLKEN